MEGTIGEIRMFAGNFAPKTWSFCSGQIVSIAQNTALFSILGTTYGGNGTTTFALPDFRGRVPVGVGQGAGLSYYALGQMSGVENVTLLQSNLPAHTHLMTGTSAGPTQSLASGGILASSSRTVPMPSIYATSGSTVVPMASQTTPAGNNMPVSIVQPYLAMNFIICMYGIYPSRN
ncbi:MAG: phage tail protein [Pseudarcicella sp.]|jgi:microcystin-dependent protein|nr:phage tail protein [Pseudarcicella sp.]